MVKNVIAIFLFHILKDTESEIVLSLVVSHLKAIPFCYFIKIIIP